MNISSGINQLLKGVQTPNPVNVYDVYSPAKQQQFILNQQNIAANQQRAQQNQIKLEEQQRQQAQQVSLEQDLADFYDTVGYINTQDSTEEELNRSVFQNQLGLAEVYKQNGLPQKAIELAESALRFRLDSQNQEDKENRTALQDLIQASHTRNQSVVDFSRKIHSDVYDKFGVNNVNIAPAAKVAERGKQERSLRTPDGENYLEKEVESFRKSIVKKAEAKEKASSDIAGQPYTAPVDVYDPKKFARLVQEYGTGGAMRQVLNPPGNNPIQTPGEAAGRNVVVIRKKQ